MHEFFVSGFEFNVGVAIHERETSKVDLKSAEKFDFSSSIFTMKEKFLTKNKNLRFAEIQAYPLNVLNHFPHPAQ